ncbi:HET-domain-containing protein [Lophiostoma macrostomum CBS 122681]|uniref:HET-domain-containing protein n=1 Tax=Lophiostoma macrostomum CBS 122681 TaxID=1314788 RepID=A0A6A6T6T0_9PLEO|nr:HET-domain-containing protein [Lophiostoma macrostomum CBS 122681]
MGISNRLCIYCRAVVPIEHVCQTLKAGLASADSLPHDSYSPRTSQSDSRLAKKDVVLIQSLQQQHSSLCQRCESYNVNEVFEKAEPLDEVQRRALNKQEFMEYNDRMSPFRLSLGQPSDILLMPSCPLCRLLYGILPSDPEAHDAHIRLEPYRSYIREFSWDLLPASFTSKCAIHLGLVTGSSYFNLGSAALTKGGSDITDAMMTGPAICYETKSAPPARNMRNARPLKRMIDLSELVKPLNICQQNHYSSCNVPKPKELVKARMIDIVDRKVIQCPPDCDYIALSYVWGGVQPVAGALEKKCLPQTIEDAITVTRSLGRRYLWVDALCIDQSPNPTPAQLKEKIEQLNMMSTIYGCATLTIVAVSGNNSNAGLPGVSSPRPMQVTETLNDRTIFTVPSEISIEIDASLWNTRAWTLQERWLSTRLLYFTENQVGFDCHQASTTEQLDTETHQKHGLPVHPTQSIMQMAVKPSSARGEQGSIEGRMEVFGGVLSSYTRRNMTNSGDSLNALLGMLSNFERQLFPGGFTHGLPLQSHPSSLGWIHDRSAKPERRPMFPSWSWAGWQGEAVIPREILDICDDRTADTTNVDLDCHVKGCNGNEITVEGWVADLDIRTEPFSEIFVPGREDSIGTVKERNLLHPNSLPTGHYSCLVVHRQSEKDSSRHPPRQKVFLVVLEWNGKIASRRTVITVTLFSGHDFKETNPEKGIVHIV